MFRPRLSLLLTTAFVVGLAPTIGGQAPAAPQEAPPTQRFGAATTAIMVDVVVRDKRGNPVTDLTAADFELLEDNVRQEIGSVTLVAPGTLASGAAPSTAVAPGGATPTANTVESPTFVAMAFDRLSPEGRGLAHKGALAYLETARDNDFAGVFLVDNALEMIQTYTTDRSALRKAIDAAASRASARFERQSDRVRSGSRGDTHAGTSPTAGAEQVGPRLQQEGPLPTPGRDQAPSPGGISERLFEQMADRMDRSYEGMMRDQQGYATINALLALIDALGLLPGRKTVVFFAEGLAIPAVVQARFDSVIATANRANVSVYTVDAAGLRVQSEAAAAARQVRGIADANMDRTASPDGGGGALTRNLELNEDVLRQDPSVALGILAERTGGILINNTNALERGFRTIDADRRFHYLLTYSPQNSDFNGEWREVTVRVPKRDVQIRSRSGYLAVRAPGALPVLAYEGPALAALEDSPLPNDLPVRAGAFSFPDAKGEGRLALLVAADASALTVETVGQTFRTDFTILARIKDATGEVVRKASQPYRLNGPAAEAANVKQGDVLFFRQPDLEPGQYTLEYVISDALGKKAGAGTQPIVVPATQPGHPIVSSLIVVRRTEKVPAAERTDDNPLYFGELLLYPSLGEPLSKSRDKTLSFYYTLQPAGSAAPAATLEILQKGQSLAQLPLQLPAPSADGRIQHTAQLPLENFPAGEYTLRVNVTQGSAKETRDAGFRVVD
jgi:VWFA-related protein